MFLVKDLSRAQQDVTEVHDTKDVLDIIIGLCDLDGVKLEDVDHVLSRMTFGDVFTRHPYFKVWCVPDEAYLLHREIEEAATRLLKTCTDDYASRIWSAIRDEVVDDVVLCACEPSGEDGFTDGDIALAIGRALAERLGSEV